MNEDKLREEFEMKFPILDNDPELRGISKEVCDFWLQKLSSERERIIKEVEGLSESKGCIGYSPTMNLRGVCCPRHLGHKDALSILKQTK